MKKTIRKFLYTALIITMTVLMATINPLQVLAAGRGRSGSTGGKILSGKTYVKDVIIVTESEACDLDGTAYGDYEVLTTPISDFGGKDGHENLFFAVLTTEDPNEAITDIKAMNMNGDYDFDAYGEYLATVEAWAQAKADTTMTAIKEFKANYKAGKPGAKFAYDMLNYLVGDNKDVPLGEFFVNDAYASTLGIQVKNLVMKSNLMMLTYVRQLLLVACSDTQDTSFVDALLTHGHSNPLINDGSNLYRTAAEDLICSMGATSRMINAYRDALAKHGDGLDAYLEKRTSELSEILEDEDIPYDEYTSARDEYDSIKDIMSGNILSDLFDDVYYIDNNGNSLTLTDILAKDPEAENESDRPTLNMVMPIVALMSEGQRGLAGCGFDKLVGSVINDYSGENSEYDNALDEILSMWDTVSKEEPVSLYSGVDLSLYDPNGIAMVGKSGEFLKNSTNSDNVFLGIPTYAAGIMAGGGVVGIVGSAVGLKNNLPIVKEVLNQRSIIAYGENSIKTYKNSIAQFTDGSAFSEKQIEVATKYISSAQDEIAAAQNELAALNPKFAGAVFKTAFSSFMLLLSVSLLIFSIVTIVMNVIHEDTPQDYTQVPRILVNAIEKTEYDERQQKMTSTQMIFYKGIIDPFMSDEKAEANNTPSKVMDVFDWSLADSDREWIALYTTTDGRVGHPIIYDGADNTLVVLTENGSSYATLEQRQGFSNRVNIFNQENYTACGDGIIVFDCDPDVESETKSGFNASMTISDGKFILFIILAATVGAGIGVGACLLVGKIRKKKEFVSVDS